MFYKYNYHQIYIPDYIILKYMLVSLNEKIVTYETIL